jgi:hypothetical protein
MKGKVVPMVGTMAYRGRAVVTPLMPTLAPVGSQCSAQCPGRFNSGQNLKHKHITLNDYCFESQTDFSCLSLSLINTKTKTPGLKSRGLIQFAVGTAGSRLS